MILVFPSNNALSLMSATAVSLEYVCKGCRLNGAVSGRHQILS